MITQKWQKGNYDPILCLFGRLTKGADSEGNYHYTRVNGESPMGNGFSKRMCLRHQLKVHYF